MTAASLAALATVLLAGGLVAAATVGPAPSASDNLAAAGKLGLSQLSVSQQAEDAPAQVSTTATTATPAPVTTVKPSAAKDAGAGSTTAPTLYGHRTPGAAVIPYSAGRSEWSGVSNGISFHLVMTPSAPRSGEVVTFVAEASIPSGLCCSLMLQTGDGSIEQYPPPPGIDDHPSCSQLDPKSNSVRGEMRHVYNKAGRWNFSFSASTGGRCGGAQNTYGSLDGQLQIGTGSASATGQGPSQPTVRPSSIWPYAPRVITFAAEARDDDGYIDRFIVEWGDGSPSETYRNPQPCKQQPSGWPGGTSTMLPHWMGVESVTHRYADDTPHTVTVTVISTACDRTAEQRVSRSLVFPEPLPPPPPLSSVPWPTGPVPPPPDISSIPVPPPGPPPTWPPGVIPPAPS